jgi:WD40 repeat protein
VGEPKLTCLSCGAVVKTATPASPGKRFRCPKCRELITVPEGPAAEAAAPSPVPSGTQKRASPKKPAPKAALGEDEETPEPPDEERATARKGERGQGARGPAKRAFHPALLWGGLGAAGVAVAVTVLVVVLIVSGVFNSKPPAQSGGPGPGPSHPGGGGPPGGGTPTGDAAIKAIALKKKLTGHKNALICAAFSPDGQTVVSGGYDESLMSWQVGDGTQQHSWQLTHAPLCLGFGVDGKSVYTVTDSLDVYDISTGQGRRKVQLSGRPGCACVSPDGTMIATCSRDGQLNEIDDPEVVVWSTQTWQTIKTLRAKGNVAYQLAFSPDSKQLAVGLGMRASKSGRLELFDLNASTSQSVDVPNAVAVIAFHPTEGLAAVSSKGMFTLDGNIHLIDLKALKVTRTLQGQGRWGKIAALAFSPNGKGLLCGGEDKAARLLKVDAGQVVAATRDFSQQIGAVAFSPDGKTAVIAGGDTFHKSSELSLWDVSGLLD